ncbi:hypothetical protein ACQ856_29380 (plasmid) [Mycolicibacterium psychrotolerans]|uniref:hypothetical protein n=1 Tax=Mycolicibacterium psychrotolerans TaxID=216929 RepID=UPI003D674389
MAEIAAPIGLTAGMFFRPMATVTAAAVVLFMDGAGISHRRARGPRPLTAVVPAVMTTVAAAAVVVLSVA